MVPLGLSPGPATCTLRTAVPTRAQHVQPEQEPRNFLTLEMVWCSVPWYIGAHTPLTASNRHAPGNRPHDCNTRPLRFQVKLSYTSALGEVAEGNRGISGDGRRLGLGWWTHNTIYRSRITQLYTWNLYNFINQYHPKNSIKIKKNALGKPEVNCCIGQGCKALGETLQLGYPCVSVNRKGNQWACVYEIGCVRAVFKAVPLTEYYFIRNFSNLWIIEKYLLTSCGIRRPFQFYLIPYPFLLM